MQDKKSPSRLDPLLLDHLFCPVSRKALEYDRSAQVLISRHAGLVFPISHNIPLLVEELAIPLDQFEQETKTEK